MLKSNIVRRCLANPFHEHPAGTWTTPQFTLMQWQSMLVAATTALAGVDDAALPLFAQGLADTKARLQEMIDAGMPMAADTTFPLWRPRFRPAESDINRFVAHCAEMAPSAATGVITYKVRETLEGALTFGMFVPHAGSVIVRRWSSAGIGVDFRLTRDTFFLDSYRDDVPAVEVPYAEWAAADNRSVIVQSHTWAPEVKTFIADGVRLVNCGVLGFGHYRECDAWAYVSRTQWTGPVYSRQSQDVAADTGRLERGDRRGLQVLVDHEPCVLVQRVRVYDSAVPKNVDWPEPEGREFDDLDA